MTHRFIPEDRTGRVTAVLGPTNTGKTHFAIERMLAHESGMIGLPLRLLAREVYDRVVAVKGADASALVTGEEKIVPRHPRYWVCTVESMPLDVTTDFLAVDEIQLCADADRGHIFTDRLLRARGVHETLLLGAETMRPIVHKLLRNAGFVSRPRFSDLAYTGHKKITRLPRRSAIVAFSAEAVYGIAELIRRQRGGAAVVMGALSPRTRNAQVALYQSGDVDFLVATDAIGMGLNMDVDHIAFASLEKFDGVALRGLRAQEMAQIAGRAGRYMNDGTFGVTAEVEGLDATLVEQIENHRFDPVKTLQWRNHELDFASVEALVRSLETPPPEKGLMRAREAGDLAALRVLAENDEIRARVTDKTAVRRLWEVCQVPDFRKVLPDEHARLLTAIFLHLTGEGGVLPEEWIAGHVARLDNTEGDIDAIAQRIAHVRTWTYAANRPGWIADAVGWQERTRVIEDKLSDALHERLTQRFIDRRTSVLMKRLKADDEFAATVGEGGECFVDNEYVGRLEGFRFAADPRALGIHGKALRAAALRGLQGEIAQRAYKLATAEDKDITLSEHGKLRWAESPVGRLARGADPLGPRVELHADELLTPTARARAQARLDQWVKDHIARTMEPLIALKRALDEAGDEKLDAPARGMAFRLVENLGSLMRAAIADDVRALQPQSRTKLRALGVRFGEFSIYLPALVKPAAAQLRALLWAVGQGMVEIPPPPQAGLTSVAVDEALPVAFYEAAGYRPLGPRAVRLDMLERLADLVRGKQKPEKPAEGEAEKLTPEKPQGFATTPEMMSILGCAEGELEGILRALGFKQTPVTMPEGAVVQMWRARRHAEEREQRRKKFEFVKKMKSSGENEKDRRAKREEKREEKVERKSALPPRRPKPEPRIDPNSPFAALAVLKTKR